MNQLRKIFFSAVMLLVFSGAAHAQFTTVSGTVTDPNGLPYANGTVTAILIPASPGGWRLSGLPYAGRISNTSMDASGTFTMQMGSNTSITPGGSQWLFTVNEPGILPPLGTGPQAFTLAITITGTTQDVSAALTAAAPRLSNFSSTAGNPCITTALSFQYNNAGAFGCVGDVTYVAGTNTILAGSLANLDFSGAASLKAKVAAGYSPTTSGLFGYDSIANQWVFGSNGSTVSFLASTVPGPDYVLTSTALNTTAFEQINGGASCGDSSHAASYDATLHRFGCQSITGTFSSPMTTVGDIIIEGAGPTPARLGGPTTPNTLAQSLISTPSGGLATAPAWGLPGMLVRAITGATATDTIAATDCQPKRVAYQGSVAVAVTLPTATTLAVPQCVLRVANNTTGTGADVTVTPTTWTVNGGASLVIHQGQAYTFYVDPSGTAWDADGSTVADPGGPLVSVGTFAFFNGNNPLQANVFSNSTITTQGPGTGAYADFLSTDATITTVNPSADDAYYTAYSAKLGVTNIPSSNSKALSEVSGGRFVSNYAGTGTILIHVGMMSMGSHTGSGIVSENLGSYTESDNFAPAILAAGSRGFVLTTGNFTMPVASAVMGTDSVSGATTVVTHSNGFYATVPAISGGATVVSQAGFYAEPQHNVLATNSYSFYAADQSTGANDWSFYSAGGKSFFPILLTTTKTPSSAADTCTTGQFAWDASFFYQCIATNTWKRVAIATW